MNCRVGLLISNHKQAEPLARYFDVPFSYLPVTAETKSEVEQQQLALVAHHSVNLIVLARYMQVLSGNFVAHYPRKMINVHHSFLPAFTGGRP